MKDSECVAPDTYLLSLSYGSGSQNVVPRPAASALFGNLLEIKILGHTLGLLNHRL